MKAKSEDMFKRSCSKTMNSTTNLVDTYTKFGVSLRDIDVPVLYGSQNVWRNSETNDDDMKAYC